MKYNLKYPFNFVSKFKTSTSSIDQIVPNDEHILKKKIADKIQGWMGGKLVAKCLVLYKLGHHVLLEI